jgi:hypothetical protein
MNNLQPGLQNPTREPSQSLRTVRTAARLGSLTAIAGFSFVVLVLSRLVPGAAFAADEICASCGQQVSVNGSFTHRKEGPSVVIEGATNNAAVFREDVNGTNFTVKIAHLPAGK